MMTPTRNSPANARIRGIIEFFLVATAGGPADGGFCGVVNGVLAGADAENILVYSLGPADGPPYAGGGGEWGAGAENAPVALLAPGLP